MISNETTQWIVSRAVGARFEPRLQEMRDRQAALARAVWEHLFPEGERAAVLALPERWQRRDTCLRVAFNGYRAVLNLPKPGLPVPPGDDGRCHPLGMVTDGLLVERWQALERDDARLREEHATACRQLSSFIRQFGSVKKLAAGWPEGKPFWTPFLPAERGGALVIAKADINNLLGLPAAAPEPADA